MATQSDIEAYQSVIDGLSTVAFAQVKSLLQSLDDPNPIAFRDALLVAYPEVMSPFMGASTQVAAQWYSTLRDQAGITSAFAPVLEQAAPEEQLQAGVRYALTPLFQPVTGTQTISFGEQILSALAGFTQKMIANAGRDTVIGSAYKDSVRVGYARVPRLGCCAFCGLLASRGAVYRSRETAGESKDFHAHCRCVVVPSFPGGDNAYVETTTEYFQGLYSDSVENVDGRRNLKATLASWRQQHGTK